MILNIWQRHWNGFQRHTCPDCDKDMLLPVVFGYNAKQVRYRMRREYCLYKGYFQPMKQGP